MFFGFFFNAAVAGYLKKWREKKKTVGVLKLLGFQGGGVDHVSPPMLRRSRWNKGGLFSPSVLAGRLFSPLPCNVCVCMSVCVCVCVCGRGDAWVILEEIHNRNSGVGASF